MKVNSDKRSTILIVDDALENRTLLARVFSDDYYLFEAENGKTALDEMRSSDIDLILLDLSMSVMDGYEVLRQMRTDSALNNIPTLIITASGDEDSLIKALDLGAIDVITKPFNIHAVQARVRNALEYQRSHRLAAEGALLKQQLAHQNEIIKLSERDSLTGLYNRDAFCKYAKILIEQKPSGYYLISNFDVNNFKAINDQYGLDIGDEVLIRIASEITKYANSHEGISCRISNDNFALLVKSDAQDILGESIEIMTKEFWSRGYRISAYVNGGRYIIDDTSLSINAILDRALLAKRTIKGSFDTHVAYFTKEMRDSYLREQNIINEMEHALKNNQFEVWFQPQYNHSTGQLIGAEALVRWRHPEHGLIAPNDFIPIFEKNGFIYELDKYVWRAACEFVKGLINKGLTPPPVSINISRYDVFRDDFYQQITGIVNKTKIPVETLRIELTESAFEKDTERIVKRIKELQDFGFIIEIDDFGSGYSSFNTLKDVPADILKLDMRFLSRSDNPQRSGNIIASIIRMSKWLSMPVIAEGVETLQQADFLKSIGCMYVQGYLYSRPLPANDYEQLCLSKNDTQFVPKLENITVLNQHEFWNPDSMDTFIFNSFIGGACIFEFYNGKVDILRANNKFMQIFNEVATDDVHHITWSNVLSKASYATAYNDIKKAIATDDEVRFEALVGTGKNVKFLRATIRVIGRTTERYLLYCICEDYTSQWKTEQKEIATRKQLDDYSRQLSFLNDISNELLNTSVVSDAIAQMLKILNAFFGGKRAFILEINNEKNSLERTYEYSPSNQSVTKNIVDLLYDSPAVKKLIASNESYMFLQLEDIANEPALYHSFKVYAINSLVLITLREQNKPVGFIGITNILLNRDKLDIIPPIGDYTSSIITRRNFERKLKLDNELLYALMNDIPDGFLQLKRIGGNKGYTFEVLFFNDTLCKMLKQSRASVFKKYTNNVTKLIHPSDLATIRAAMQEASAFGKAEITYRLRTATDEYLSTQAFIRCTRKTDNYEIFNFYHLTYSDNILKSEWQNNVLNNLPSTTGIFNVTDNKIKLIYLNDKLVKTLNKTTEDYLGEKYLSAIHPDDVDAFIGAILNSDKTDYMFDLIIRLKSNDIFASYRVMGKTVLENDGILTVYTTIALVSENETSLWKMLPTMFGNVLSSTTDYVFVKDLNLKYVFASNNYAKLIGLNDATEIIGKTDYDLFDTEIADGYLKSNIKFISNREPTIDVINCLTVNDVTNHYLMTSRFPLFDSSDNLLGILCVARAMLISSNVEVQNILSSLYSQFYSIFLIDVTNESVIPLTLSNDVGTFVSDGLITWKKFFEDFILNIVALPYRTTVLSHISLDVIRNASNNSNETILKLNSGKWMSISINAITVEDGKTQSALITMRDVSEMQMQYDKSALYADEERKKAINYSQLFFEAATDKFTSIIKVNVKTLKTWHIKLKDGSISEVAYRGGWKTLYASILKDVHPDDVNEVTTKLLNGDVLSLSKSGKVSATYRSRSHSKDYRWYTTELNNCARDSKRIAIDDNNDESITFFTTNINDEMFERNRLLSLSEHDSLTDLFNRTKLKQLDENEYSKLSTCGVIFMDINDLKLTNDTLGHDIGDLLIRQVADGIRSVTDRRIHGYRYGGDEFLIVICNATLSELDVVTQLCQTRFALLSQNTGYLASVAIGTAWSESPVVLNKLITKADKKMYENKSKLKK